MVKEDSFGLFGWVGRGRGGCWRKEERGGGPGEGAGEREGVEGRRRSGSEGGSEGTGREVEAGRRGKACSLSERNNVERAKEGDSHREGVRVFGQQPPGVWSLSNTRDIRGLGFLWFGQGGRGLWILGGVCFVWVLVIEVVEVGLGFGGQRYYYYICTTILNNLIMGVNKSITIEGATFRFEVKSKDAGEEARVIMSAEDSKEVVDAIDTVRGWVKPRGNRPFTDQEFKF
nr:MAG: hypothetical protein [Bacteriophage sp.]